MVIKSLMYGPINKTSNRLGADRPHPLRRRHYVNVSNHSEHFAPAHSLLLLLLLLHIALFD